MEDEKEARPFGPVPTAATEAWRTHPLQFTPRAGPAVLFGGPVAQETSNLCYMFGMSNKVNPVEKAFMSSSSAAITYQDSVNSNLVPLIVDRRAPGHYLDNPIIRNLKHRSQDCMPLITPGKIITSRGAMLDGMVEGVQQGLINDDYGNKILVRSEIVAVPGIGLNLISVMASAKKDVVTIFDYENLGLKEFNVTVPLQSENCDL